MASAVLCDVQITVKQAQKKFRDWMDKGTRIPPNLREVVYIAGKRDRFYQLYYDDDVSIISSSSDEMSILECTIGGSMKQIWKSDISEIFTLPVYFVAIVSFLCIIAMPRSSYGCIHS